MVEARALLAGGVAAGVGVVQAVDGKVDILVAQTRPWETCGDTPAP